MSAQLAVHIVGQFPLPASIDGLVVYKASVLQFIGARYRLDVFVDIYIYIICKSECTLPASRVLLQIDHTPVGAHVCNMVARLQAQGSLVH